MKKKSSEKFKWIETLRSEGSLKVLHENTLTIGSILEYKPKGLVLLRLHYGQAHRQVPRQIGTEMKRYLVIYT